MKITPSKAQIDQFTGPESSKVEHGGDKYYYYPFWVRNNADGSWERISFDQIPDPVVKLVGTLRDVGIKEYTHPGIINEANS